jgi:hypothetical protein
MQVCKKCTKLSCTLIKFYLKKRNINNKSTGIVNFIKVHLLTTSFFIEVMLFS